MSEKFTIEEARDQFIDIEKKYSVYSLESNGVYYWKLVRFELFNCIMRKLNLLNDGHPLNNKDKLKRLGLLVRYSLLNIRKNKNIKESDVIVLTHGRKQKHNDRYIDIYLDDIITDLINDKKDFLIIDRPDHYGNHYKPSYENYIYFERFAHIVREGLYKLFAFKMDLSKSQTVLEDIKKEIESIYNINIELVELIKKRIFRYTFEKKYFDKIINKVKPTNVILVASYGKEELIASAQERSIKVTEVQHGVISKYHMGYYFPYNYEIKYFPDELILFGDYWRESVSFPINSELSVKSITSMKPINLYTKNGEKEEKVLFVSQGSIGPSLAKVASTFSNENKIECYYKLHPSEFSNWKIKYPELAKSEALGNIKVITNQKTIYELFSFCKYVIGVYSTAIYESLMYNCITFLVKIEGYQYMDYLINNNYIKLLPNEFNIKDLNSFRPKKLEKKEYFYC